MNDLFSNSSFKKYTDLKKQVREDGVEDIELGEGGANLDSFFAEVDAVKADLSDLEKIRRRLQDANEEAKLAHNATTVKTLREKMDGDVEQVLKRAKLVKGKLEALDRSNAAHRKVQGSGPGSSTDRTRTAVVLGLGKKLKDLMDDFQALRSKIAAEYKETVERRYFTVTGKQPDEGMIERLIASGESEMLLQKAIQEQGRGQIMDTISEIQERHDAVKEIEKNLMDLHQVFLDMAALVEAQGHQLNDIESHVAHASSFVRRGTDNLEVARDYQKSSRKWYCIAILLVLLLVVVLLLPFLNSILTIAHL